jgi:hypothetical protein
MSSRLRWALIGAALAIAGAGWLFIIWRGALLGTTPHDDDANLAGAFGAPVLCIAGFALLAFPYNRLMMPHHTYTGRKMMTPLGWAFFVLGLAAAAGNVALLIYVTKKD